MTTRDLGQLSMFELFRIEADANTQVLTKGLLVLERDPTSSETLEACMRAAHSLKGGARILGLEAAVSVAHAMEDCLVAAQHGRLRLTKAHIDALLRGVDCITRAAGTNDAEAPRWSSADAPGVAEFHQALAQAVSRPDAVEDALPEPSASAPAAGAEGSDRFLRVTAGNFNRLLSLAGDSLVEARWLQPFARSLLRLKEKHHETVRALDLVRDGLPELASDGPAVAALAEARRRTVAAQHALAERVIELEQFDRRIAGVAQRLYDEALTCRMRPFSDGVQPFPRMVRDLAHSLGKRVRLEIVGDSTQVDREVLEKIEGPLLHLLRNALDHGIELPERRRAAGKTEEGVVRLHARHVGGMLQISVSDDGRGIDRERVRTGIIDRGLLNREAALKLSEAELFDFLFLPGFTVKESVSEISGRGVGLDAVLDAVRSLRGSVRISSHAEQGTSFELLLPLTVSLLRSLLVEIGGEPYAFPLAYIDRTLTVARSELATLVGRQHFSAQGRQVGLVSAHQIFECQQARNAGDQLPVIVLQHQGSTYGLIVDRFLGARELAVQPLDPRLGHVRDISASALLEDGSPVLIVDVRDLLISIERLISSGDLAKACCDSEAETAATRKRVLVVDDSLTVRELERKIIEGGGYTVEVAVDGVDGWNAVRAGSFNLVVTDIDMPRLDGIELVRLIRQDARVRSVPVMIVSYKDRAEDRQRGLEAGADYYLAKSSFHGQNLLQAVCDLIGEP